MRKMLSVLMGVVLIAGLSGVAFADTAATGVASVYVNVVKNVSIQAPSVAGNNNIQTGDITLTVTFTVDANTQQVNLCAGASALYKGDIWNGWTVNPIPLKGSTTPGLGMPSSGGIKITPTLANTLSVHPSNVAAYNAPSSDIGGYPGFVTECVGFESSQNNRFSQPVALEVKWTQSDPEQPTGQYSGKVKIFAYTI
jgi:hypothetical protein